MNENKELFLEEYTKICQKYNCMLEPDIMAALLIKDYDKNLFYDTIEEIKELENYYEGKTSFKWDF